jgi:hypothetical protein
MKLNASIRKIIFVALPTLGLLFSANQAFADEVYRVRNKGGKCLEVQNGFVSVEHQFAWIWNCNNDDSQKWVFQYNAAQNFFTIKTTGGKCLDMAFNINRSGSMVWLSDCNGSDAQKWRTFQWGDGTWGIQNVQNGSGGRCLDIKDAEFDTIGTPTHMWSCSSSTQQQWYLDFLGTTNASLRK